MPRNPFASSLPGFRTILVIVPRNLSSTGDLQAQVQKRVLDVLAQQVVTDYATGGVELRRMGLETLHQILEASGHPFVVGWETIFEMLGRSFRGPGRRTPAPGPQARSANRAAQLNECESKLAFVCSLIPNEMADGFQGMSYVG